MQFCTVLYSVVQCCTVLYSGVQCCIVLYSVVQFCTVLYSGVQWVRMFCAVAQGSANNRTDLSGNIQSSPLVLSYVMFCKCINTFLRLAET